MLVFRKGQWLTIEVPVDPMFSLAHKQRLAAAIATKGVQAAEKEFYEDMFHSSLGNNIAAHRTVKKSAV